MSCLESGFWYMILTPLKLKSLALYSAAVYENSVNLGLE